MEFSCQHPDVPPLIGAASAFVVHVEPETTTAGAQLRGRVEHVRSGRAAAFRGLDQLLSFMHRTLSELDVGPS